MNEQLLKDSVEVLKDLRTELHGKAEDCVLVALNKVIADLEQALLENPAKMTPKDILVLVGSILEKLPAIVEAVKIITGS